MFLLLDGVLAVEVDGKPVGELGPGAIVGELAVLEGGTRTATLRATTRGNVVTVPAGALESDALAQLASGRRQG